MGKFTLITDAEQQASFSAEETVSLVSSAELGSHLPDAHWLLAENGAVCARCSLWWQNLPEYPEQRLGFIGHYAASNEAAAGKLLRHACAELAGQGCTLAVGPLDGTTWRRYRLITQRGEEPPFFLEPDNPDTYPHQFETAGFSPLARYYSSLDDNPVRNVSLPEGLINRLQRGGVSLRHLDRGAFMDELSRIHGISVVSFRNNFLYTDISLEEFIGMYTKVEPYVTSDLVLFAEQNGRPVGFIFALPDMLRLQKGHPADTVIIKSLAVVPEMNGKGVGAWLLAQVSHNARLLGFKRAIHALMQENNRSRDLSSHYGRVIRQYTLYARTLS